MEEQAREFKTNQSCRLTGDTLVDHGVITKKECDNIRLEMKGLISDVSKNIGSTGRKLSTKKKIQQNAPEESIFQIAVSEDRLEAHIQVKKHFSGKINGFVVKCGNLNAKEIVGGKILASRNVMIQGGVINSNIKTEGSIKAKFITDSNIKCFGDVIVDKEVINSKIRSSGKFMAERGKIMSSFISAKMGFESKEVGTDVSHPCRINVGLDENVKKRIQAFNHILNDKKKTLESLQKSYEKQMKGLKTIHYKMSEQKLLDKKNDQNLSAIETIIKEIESINEEKHAILKWSKKEKGSPFINVTGFILQGTKLFGIHSSTTLREAICNVTIKEIKQAEKNFWTMMILESK